MKIETVNGKPTRVFHVDDIHGVAADVFPRGMGIEGGDDEGNLFRLEIDFLQLADILAGLRDHLTANGQPAVGVTWHPHKTTVDVFSAGHEKVSTPETQGKKDPVM